MSRNSIYGIILLTIGWVILRESLTALTFAEGIVISAGCIYFCNKLLPLPKTSDINLFRFVLYLLFLAGQVYKSGFWAIKIILTGARTEIIKTDLEISSAFLQTILANSITLVPGSISLELKDNTLTVLWLAAKKTDALQAKNAGELIIRRLEKMLIKMQK